jgi:hypothetical protein
MRNKVYTKRDRLSFGKHKGEQLIDVIVGDPHYLTWCIENIDGFELDNDAYEMYETFLEPQSA